MESQKNLPVLRSTIISWLKGQKDETLQQIAMELRDAKIVEDGNTVRLGDWILDEESNTATRFMPPDQDAGYDFVLHLKKIGPSWEVVRLERREVRRTGKLPSP